MLVLSVVYTIECAVPSTRDLSRPVAAITFAPDSEAALHTRMLAAKDIVSIAGAIPQATPSPPLPPADERPGDGREADA
jgi:hypothetical protein